MEVLFPYLRIEHCALNIEYLVCKKEKEKASIKKLTEASNVSCKSKGLCFGLPSTGGAEVASLLRRHAIRHHYNSRWLKNGIVGKILVGLKSFAAVNNLRCRFEPHHFVRIKFFIVLVPPKIGSS